MPRSLGYRRILVPIRDNAESEQALDVACRLASEHGASITVVTAVEVAPLLPLDAHMVDEEAHAHRLIERAAAIADSYGVGIARRIVRSREPGRTILDEAVATRAEILVIGAPRRTGARGRASVFGRTVDHVLRGAPCRVMVIGTRPSAAEALRDAAA